MATQTSPAQSEADSSDSPSSSSDDGDDASDSEGGLRSLEGRRRAAVAEGGGKLRRSLPHRRHSHGFARVVPSFSADDSSVAEGSGGNVQNRLPPPTPPVPFGRSVSLGHSALPHASLSPLPPSPGFKEFVRMGEAGGGGPGGSRNGSSPLQQQLPYGMGTPSAKAMEGAARANNGTASLRRNGIALAAAAAVAAMPSTPEEEVGTRGCVGKEVGAEVTDNGMPATSVHPAAALTSLSRRQAENNGLPPLPHSIAAAAAAQPPSHFPPSRLRPAAPPPHHQHHHQPFLMSSRACLAEGWDVVDEDEVVLSPSARTRLYGEEEVISSWEC